MAQARRYHWRSWLCGVWVGLCLGAGVVTWWVMVVGIVGTGGCGQ